MAAISFSLTLSFRVGAKTIHIPRLIPLLGISLRLFSEQPAFLAIIQFLISLSNVQEMQDLLAAIYRCKFTGGVPIDVQRPDITTKFHQEFHAEFVASRRCQVQACITEIIGFVRIASTKESCYAEVK